MEDNNVQDATVVAEETGPQTISESLLKRLRALYTENQQLTEQYGKVSLHIADAQRTLDNILARRGELAKQEETLRAEVQEEYGTGSVDLTKGTFVPAEDPAQ